MPTNYNSQMAKDFNMDRYTAKYRYRNYLTAFISTLDILSNSSIG